MDRKFMFMKTKLTPGGCLPLPRGYIHVYDHNIFYKFTTKNKNGNKGNILYLLHLTSSKNHYKTIISKQQWWLWDRK